MFEQQLSLDHLVLSSKPRSVFNLSEGTNYKHQRERSYDVGGELIVNIRGSDHTMTPISYWPGRPIASIRLIDLLA